MTSVPPVSQPAQVGPWDAQPGPATLPGLTRAILTGPGPHQGRPVVLSCKHQILGPWCSSWRRGSSSKGVAVGAGEGVSGAVNLALGE